MILNSDRRYIKPSVNPTVDEFPMAEELPGRACVSVDPCYGADAFDCGATAWYTNVRWTNSPRKGQVQIFITILYQKQHVKIWHIHNKEFTVISNIKLYDSRTITYKTQT